MISDVPLWLISGIALRCVERILYGNGISAFGLAGSQPVGVAYLNPTYCVHTYCYHSRNFGCLCNIAIFHLTYTQTQTSNCITTAHNTSDKTHRPSTLIRLAVFLFIN